MSASTASPSGAPLPPLRAVGPAAWWPAVRAVLPAFMLSRVLVLLAAAVAPFLLPVQVFSDIPWYQAPQPVPPLVDAFVRWDSIHYLSVATGGYVIGDTAWNTNTQYMPLFPLLARLLGGWAGTAGIVVAGLLIANGAFLAALALLRSEVAAAFDRATADRAVVFLSVFPASLFFSAFYTESLFLLLALTTFACVRRGRWWGAAAATALAATCRVPGVLLALPIAVGWWQAYGFRPATLPSLAIRLAPIALGPLATMALLYADTGDPLATAHTARLWGYALVSPTEHLANAARLLAPDAGRVAGPGLIIPLLVLLLFFAAIGWVLRRRQWGWGAWLLTTMLLYLAFPTPTPLASMPRWLLPLFPAYAAFAWWGRKPVFRALYLVLSLVLLALSTMLFTRWYWVA